MDSVQTRQEAWYTMSITHQDARLILFKRYRVMPIYEYKCHVCGYIEDVLQKFSDQPLTICPKCNKPTFNKLISMPAAFDLKGDGWYVTDFKNKTASATTGAGDSKVESATKLAAANTESKNTTGE
ncbi:MAG: FmdB family zinc ribbon protein [Gammaproteobacteria bacterium]